MLVGINARQRGDDVIRRMRLQRGVVVGHQHPIIRDEIQQIGHLLQVGRNIRVIADKVNVIELNINHVLDLPSRGI